MATTVKNKIRLGTLFLFVLVLLSCGVGIYNLVRLKQDADRILKNNYESLDYCHSIQQLLDNDGNPSAIDSLLRLQESNVTEPGENEATKIIRGHFEIWRKKPAENEAGARENALSAIRGGLQEVLRLNMSAIEAKNNKARDTADTALAFISFIAAIVFLVGLSFSYNFPAILTEPINAFSEGIDQISKRNYQYRIELNRRDEFGRMANAFNTMAERLEYFENSNLNKIIFEKTRAEAVINSLKDASFGIDKKGTVLFANDQALQLLGLQAKDIVGMPVTEVSSRNDLFRFLLEDQGNLPFKVVVDNRENYFIREQMQIDQEGYSSKVIVLKNITSFKELDVAKTNFIATISHELKTPLAASDLGLKLLEDERVGLLSGEQRDLIAQLKADNLRMLSILSELLNMAQVEAGKIQLDISAAAPESIMDNAIRLAQAAAKEKNLTITRDYANGLQAVNADADKTVWVLNNFLTNAIKYSPEGAGISVSISQSGDRIQFAVSDAGPGIEPIYQSKIFDRFFKVPGSRAGGTGLGLAISKEFIEAQGGNIWVQSQPGTGSRFGFDLPTYRNFNT
ncbi:sensor histidine kinase [Flavihumibacter petaseus]|nr:ATP-binding protein [Flavihumibacter petaseus]